VTEDDREDRAIVRAFGIDAPDEGGADDAMVDEYREVVAHLSDDVTPPPELEDRVVAAAVARRPAATTAIGGAPSARRRRSGVRYAAVAIGTAAVAVIVIAALVIRPDTSATHPSGGVEPIAVSRADVAALAAQPNARTGTLSNGLGQVVLASNGTGYVSDLSSTGTIGVWVDTADSTTHLGNATPQNGIVAFKVDQPEAVRVVRITATNGAELGRATLTTS
jgi:hypothetical protein